MDSVIGLRLSIALADIWPQSAPFQVLNYRHEHVRSRIRDHDLR
jgi:hypothetical protein